MAETKKLKAGFQGEVVRQLAEILNDTNLTEIEYELDNSRIRVVRQPAPQTIMAPMPMNGMGSMMSALPPQGMHQPVAQPLNTHSTEAPASAPVAADPASHPGVVKSPMVGTAYLSPSPGADPFITVGSTVSEGATLLIVEAMKVMNPIRATKSGIVKQILVRDSDPVEYDQPLVIVE